MNQWLGFDSRNQPETTDGGGLNLSNHAGYYSPDSPLSRESWCMSARLTAGSGRSDEGKGHGNRCQG